MRFFLFLIAATIFLSGCATPLVIGMDKQQSHFSPPESSNKGFIYIYREWSYEASLRGVFITADGKRIGGVNSGTYFVYETEPKTVVISCENWLGKDPARTITVEPGKSYYLKVDLKIGFLDTSPRITIVSQEEGEQAVRDCKYRTLRE